MELLQYVFLFVLNLIYKITGQIGTRVRHIIIGISFFLMICFFFCCYSSELFKIDLSYTQKGYINMIPMGIIIIMSIDRPLKAIKWNHIISIPWFLCGVIFFVSCLAMDMSDGFMPMAICMLFLFPCFYLVWNNRGDYDTLFLLVAKALTASLIVFFIICILFAPINEHSIIAGRYRGPTGNPNHLGMISAAGVTCALYLIVKAKRFVWIPMLSCEMAVSLILLAESRTSLISIIAQLGIFLIFYLRYYLKENDKLRAVVKLLLVFCLIITCIPINRAILSNAIIPVKEPVTKIVKQAAKEGKTLAREKRQAKRAEKAKRSADINQEVTNLEDTANGESEQLGTIGERINVEGADLNQLSSGRIAIWKAYLNEISWKGHGPDYAIQDFDWAHNVFIEFGYRAGAAVGILYLWVAVYAGTYIFKCLFSKRRASGEMHYLFSALAIASFCITSMLERALFPLDREFIFLYFLAVTPLFYNGRKKWKKKNVYPYMERRKKGKAL